MGIPFLCEELYNISIIKNWKGMLFGDSCVV